MTFLDELTPGALADEGTRLGYTPAQLVTALEARIARDQAYLHRRRARGTHTPTDDVMSADLPVLALVARFIHCAPSSMIKQWTPNLEGEQQ